MIKKFFFISLFFLILLVIILVAYNFAFKNNSNNPEASSSVAVDETTTPTTTEPITSSKIDNPLNEEVVGVSIANNGDLYYFSITDKALKKASFEGKDKEVLLSNLPGFVERVLWSPDRTKALLALRQGNNLRFHTADLANATLTPLKPEVSRATWSLDGSQIYYQYTNPTSGERSLDASLPDGTSFRTITSLGRIDHFIEALPQSNQILFWTRPTGLETTIFRAVNNDGSNIHTLFEGRYGGDYLPSPNGQNILAQFSPERSSDTLNLFLLNSTGGELRGLGVPSFTSKSIWSKDSQTLYYALPGNIPAGSVVPNDYYQRPFFTTDTFWKIDTETGRKDRLIELDESKASLDATDFFLSPQEDYLFFTDRQTHKLYRIAL